MNLLLLQYYVHFLPPKHLKISSTGYGLIRGFLSHFLSALIFHFQLIDSILRFVSNHVGFGSLKSWLLSKSTKNHDFEHHCYLNVVH